MYENSHSLLDLQSCIESFIKLTSSWESLVISSTNRIKCVWAVKFLKKLIILAYFALYSLFALRLHDCGLCDKNSSCVTVLHHPLFPWSSCSLYKVTLVTWSYCKNSLPLNIGNNSIQRLSSSSEQTRKKVGKCGISMFHARLFHHLSSITAFNLGQAISKVVALVSFRSLSRVVLQ